MLLGTRVYDVTGFLRMHPGGEALILRRSGKDVSREIEGPPHRHSENARRWMEQYYIGELDKDSIDEDTETLRQRKKIPESTTEEEEEETSAINKCSKVNEETDLVDWRKPLAWQVGYLGEKYDVGPSACGQTDQAV